MRSETDTSITFMIPMPATVSEIAAMPTSAAVSSARMRPNVASTESWVSIVTSSSPSWRSISTRRTASSAAAISSCDRTSISRRNNPDWLNIFMARPTGTKTMSSMSIPIDMPRGARTPMIRKRSSPRRSHSPRGFSAPKSSRRTVDPITQTRCSRAASPAGRKRPVWIARLRTPRKSAVVPVTVTSRRRSPRAAGAAPRDSGARRRTERTRFNSASASSSVRSCGAPVTKGVTPEVSVLPGRTMRRLVPRLANSPVT